jgi:hypothetical protein
VGFSYGVAASISTTYLGTDGDSSRVKAISDSTCELSRSHFRPAPYPSTHALAMLLVPSLNVCPYTADRVSKQFGDLEHVPYRCILSRAIHTLPK